nr:D-sedoheptulose 7-phosphate isomerase [Succinivibrionaceae bacterium]
FISAPGTQERIEAAIALMSRCLRSGGHIISAGNGGSMCDAQHFAEELTGRFRGDRPAYGAVAACDPSHLTCVGNDYGFDEVFARFVEGMGREGDVFLGISTSGNSRNIIRACEAARQRGMGTVCLLGKDGGKLRSLCDLPITVPHQGFADRIQEVHTMVIHILIRGIEETLAS